MRGNLDRKSGALLLALGWLDCPVLRPAEFGLAAAVVVGRSGTALCRVGSWIVPRTPERKVGIRRNPGCARHSGETFWRVRAGWVGNRVVIPKEILGMCDSNNHRIDDWSLVRLAASALSW